MCVQQGRIYFRPTKTDVPPILRNGRYAFVGGPYADRASSDCRIPWLLRRAVAERAGAGATAGATEAEIAAPKVAEDTK